MSEPDPTEVMPTMSPPIMPMSEGGHGSNGQVVHDALALVGPAPVEVVAKQHGRCAHQQRGAQRLLDVGLRRLASYPGGAADTPRGRPSERSPSTIHPTRLRLTVPLLQVHGCTERPHDHRGHQVARDGGGRLHVEQEDEHGRHQRAASRSGQTHQEAHDGTARGRCTGRCFPRITSLPQCTASKRKLQGRCHDRHFSRNDARTYQERPASCASWDFGRLRAGTRRSPPAARLGQRR